MRPNARLALATGFVLGLTLLRVEACFTAAQEHRRPDGEIPAVLILDLAGDGVVLTAPDRGVSFDFGPGSVARTGWTVSDSDDAFIIRDRNRNGFIDGIGDLLGGSGPPNGFDFLRALDGFATLADIARAQHSSRRPDGMIDRGDGIMAGIGLWQDVNHNGRSEEAELQGIVYAGIESISLRRIPIQRRDSGGNLIVEKARAMRTHASGRQSVDVVAVQLAVMK